MQTPTIFKPVGEIFNRLGTKLIVVKRPKGLELDEACRDCFFSISCVHQLQCSKFDREDGVSVWFKEIK